MNTLKANLDSYAKTFSGMSIRNVMLVNTNHKVATITIIRKSTVQAWLSLPAQHAIGFGKAGGYGYDKESTAIANAFLNMIENVKANGTAIDSDSIVMLANDIKATFHTGEDIAPFFKRHGLIMRSYLA